MADSPTPTPPLLNSLTRWSVGFQIAIWVGPSASLTWPTANLAFYIPFHLPFPYVVRRVYWVNGSDVTSVNRDFGIYNAEGTRLYSTGSTAASGASDIQYVTPSSEFLLAPGRYYMALSNSSTTANRGPAGIVTVSTGQITLGTGAGVVQQASAVPLPATMTPATVGLSLAVPLCGITNTSSGF